jgi:hypothetical protein
MFLSHATRVRCGERKILVFPTKATQTTQEKNRHPLCASPHADAGGAIIPCMTSSTHAIVTAHSLRRPASAQSRAGGRALKSKPDKARPCGAGPSSRRESSAWRKRGEKHVGYRERWHDTKGPKQKSTRNSRSEKRIPKISLLLHRQ